MHSTVSQIAPAVGVHPHARGGDTAWISARISAHAAAMPSQVAIIDEAGPLRWSELVSRANSLAMRLREFGAGPGACVGLYLERSTEFVVSALAVLKTGAAYLPLDSSTPPERVTNILADAQALLLLSHRGKSAGLAPGAWRTIELNESSFSPQGDKSDVATDEPSAPTSESLAYVIYTSGSTGRPKGVEITHANLQNLIEWHQAAFGITASDRASQVAGFGFDAAAWEIWPHLTAGATLHIADERTRRSPQALHDWLIAERITVSFIPTVMAEQLLFMSWPDPTALRWLLTGADTLHRRPPSHLPFALVNNYGPTECTVVATSGIVRADASASGAPSIGRPIANTTALVLDDALRPVPAGEVGELCLGGALVGRGYRNAPEMTASRFVMYTPAEGPKLRIYRTGDRVRLLESGEFAFLGRVDDQVKIRGYRIELGEIIASLDRHPGIQASAVTVRDGAGSAEVSGAEPMLVAYVVLAAEGRVTGSELREFLAARLPEYMIPSQFVALAAFPITANGKLDKRALPAPAATNLLPSGSEVAHAAETSTADGSGSAIEPRIASIVATLLEKPAVQRDDNFFMLGGHSMLGVQLVAKIRDTFGVKLTLRQLFSSPTVAGLSAEVERLSAATNATQKGATAPA